MFDCNYIYCVFYHFIVLSLEAVSHAWTGDLGRLENVLIIDNVVMDMAVKKFIDNPMEHMKSMKQNSSSVTWEPEKEQ